VTCGDITSFGNSAKNNIRFFVVYGEDVAQLKLLTTETKMGKRGRYCFSLYPTFNHYIDYG
jgi:hypothetical protein